MTTTAEERTPFIGLFYFFKWVSVLSVSVPDNLEAEIGVYEQKLGSSHEMTGHNIDMKKLVEFVKSISPSRHRWAWPNVDGRNLVKNSLKWSEFGWIHKKLSGIVRQIFDQISTINNLSNSIPTSLTVEIWSKTWQTRIWGKNFRSTFLFKVFWSKF